MKALTFIEFYKKQLELVQEDGFINQQLFNEDVTDYYYFANEPFNPEMITEFFEGVKKIKRIEYIYYLIQEKFGIATTPTSNNFIRYEGILKFETISFPQTLNDFIYDCKRAGIDLQWSEKARKELGL